MRFGFRLHNSCFNDLQLAAAPRFWAYTHSANTQEPTHKIPVDLQCPEDFIGIDPGANDYNTAALPGDTAQQRKTQSCSSRELYQRCGMHKAARQQAFERRANPEVCAWWSAIPSSKTTRLEEVLVGERHRARGLAVALDFHLDKSKSRERRRRVCIRKDQTLAAVACELVQAARRDDRPLVVGMGNASADHGSCISRFYIGSHKKLVRALDDIPQVVVIPVDEFCTSRYCSTCVRNDPWGGARVPLPGL